MGISWEKLYAQRVKNMTSSAIRELLKLTLQPEMISFAGGLPAPEVFPVEAFKAGCDRVLQESGAQALQYSTTEGYLPLRELVVDYLARDGIMVSVENILITSGSQQALDLIGKIFIDPGDSILVEEPTYLGALQAWKAYGAAFETIPIDEYGMVADSLEEKLQTRPKFIYALPTFQNPTGVTIDAERRVKIVETADRFGIPIVEDDPYSQLRYEGQPLQPLIAVDSQFRGNGSRMVQGNVISLGTFSKIMAPGLRLAWVIAPQEVILKLVQAKQAADLHTSTFNQMVAYEVCRDHFLDQHIQLIRNVYGERRILMLDSMAEFFPAEVIWTKPQGGLFVWATLPEGLTAQGVFKEAVLQKVAFVPGEVFFARGGGERTMRINFSNASPENICLGIERLGKVIKTQLVNR